MLRTRLLASWALCVQPWTLTLNPCSSDGRGTLPGEKGIYCCKFPWELCFYAPPDRGNLGRKKGFHTIPPRRATEFTGEFRGGGGEHFQEFDSGSCIPEKPIPTQLSARECCIAPQGVGVEGSRLSSGSRWRLSGTSGELHESHQPPGPF